MDDDGSSSGAVRLTSNRSESHWFLLLARPVLWYQHLDGLRRPGDGPPACSCCLLVWTLLQLWTGADLLV